MNIGNGDGGATAANPNYYIGQGTGANVNVFQGRLHPTRSDAVIFDSIPIDPPGGGERIIRISNLRANASALGTGSVPIAIFGLIQSLALTGEFSIPIVNANPVIGVLQTSHSGSVQPGGAASEFSPCTPQNPALAASPGATGTSQFSVRFTELIPSGFTSRTGATFAGENTSPPPVSQNLFYLPAFTETGYLDLYFPDLGVRGNLALAGLADHGTRLVARFTNVPLGVKLFGPAAITVGTPPNASVARLVQTDYNGAGAFLSDSGERFRTFPDPDDQPHIGHCRVRGPDCVALLF